MANTCQFMVETDVIYMEVVEPREIFIHPLGFKVLEQYAEVFWAPPWDKDAERLGTYKEKLLGLTSDRNNSYMQI